MLPKNLLRINRKSRVLEPSYLKITRNNLELAEDLIAIFDSCVGLKQSALEDDLAEVVASSRNYKIVKGLIHLLHRRVTHESVNAEHAMRLRRLVFVAMRQLSSTKRFTEEGRAEAFSKIAKQEDLSEDYIDQNLYADLKGEQKIGQFDAPTPEQLLQRYNLALAQTMLFDADSLIVEITPDAKQRPQVLRKLIGQIKFYGLLSEITEYDETLRFVLDGPNAIFDQQQKYGLALAAFLPVLFRYDHWQAEAKLRVKGSKNLRSFYISPDSFAYEAPALPFRLAEQAQYLCDRIIELGQGRWQVVDEVPIFREKNQAIWVPDLCFSHTETGDCVSVDIIAPWQVSYAKARLDWLRSSIPRDLIIALCSRAKLPKDFIKNPPEQVVLYKRTVRANQVLALMNRLVERRLL